MRGGRGGLDLGERRGEGEVGVRGGRGSCDQDVIYERMMMMVIVF